MSSLVYISFVYFMESLLEEMKHVAIPILNVFSFRHKHNQATTSEIKKQHK